MGTRLDELTGIETTGECIEWAGCRDRDGYGQIRLGGRTQSAHRVSYELHVGPIPDSMTIDHICFNRACVNPRHLRLLTNEDNARNHRFGVKRFCVNGHEYTPDNTYVTPGSGHRDCRQCVRDRAARYKARKAVRRG